MYVGAVTKLPLLIGGRFDRIACGGMAVVVRRAVAEDAPAIAAVHVAAWQVAYRGLLPDELLDGLSVSQREESWREALGSASRPEVFVAVENETVLGFCALATPSRDDDADDSVAEVGAIYVAPDVWRAGVGRALMEAALEALRSGNWRYVTLWVLATNEQARGFYARFGFEPDGSQTTYKQTGQTEVRLRAPLLSPREA